MNLAVVLAEQAARAPSRPAIIDADGRVTTFAALEDAAARAAAMLRTHGLGAGDKALIFQPMSAELYVALVAVIRLGAAAMFVDPSAGREHLDHCCFIAQPKVLIASARAHLLRLRSAALRSIATKYSIGWPMPRAHRWRLRERFTPLHQIEPATASTPALLTFTSGSTGKPKAAVRSHGFLLAQHRVLARSIDLADGEVDLATLPIFTLANLASGVTSVVPDADLRRPGSIRAAPVLHQIEKLAVTRCSASPAFFERLLAAGNSGAMQGLRKICTGGAPVFPRLLDALQCAAPLALVEAVYGSTEAEPICHIDSAAIRPADRELMQSGGGLLAGSPVPEIELRILRWPWQPPSAAPNQDCFDAAAATSGEVGEIIVSGPHVLRGYLNGAGDEETKISVGGKVWHRTGDAGRLDAGGRLWLMGRCVGRIDDDRGVLWPFAVECAAMEDPNARRCAVIADGGRRLLVIEPVSAADGAAIQSGMLRRLAWAQLDEVRLIPKLPVDKRHNAKVDYPALRQLIDRTAGKTKERPRHL